jgi:DNA-binding MarR family transcriptional regulator
MVRTDKPVTNPQKRLYEDWAVAELLHQTEGIPLNRCEMDILRHLAENGPRTKYDLTKGSPRSEYLAAKSRRSSKYEPKLPARRGRGLGYRYPYIHRSAAHLIGEKLVSEATSRKGRRRKLLRLTF